MVLDLGKRRITLSYTVTPSTSTAINHYLNFSLYKDCRNCFMRPESGPHMKLMKFNAELERNVGESRESTK
jgi:hypothetical protein